MPVYTPTGVLSPKLRLRYENDESPFAVDTGLHRPRLAKGVIAEENLSV